jgi:protein TonB
MVWRKSTTEETDELRLFVDAMKRGQTPPTNDSLLETLRQIHDRREAPVVGHDHRQLLQERIRRQIRLREGLPVEDTVPVPVFAPPPAPRRFLQWALAASLAVHVGLGVFALQNIRFDELVIGYGAPSPSETAEPARVLFVPLPPLRVEPQPDRRAPVSTESPTPERVGRGAENQAPAGVAGPAVVRAPGSQPVGPPVAPAVGGPIVSTYQDVTIAGQADRGIPVDDGPSLAGPEAPRPFSEVMSGRAERIEEAYDVEPRILFKPSPTYSDMALRYEIKGTVRVSVVLGADGTVRDVKVIKSLGYGLDEAAVESVRRIKFVPAQRGGIPVSVRIKVDVSFGLR